MARPFSLTGLPHSDTRGSLIVYISPRRFAVFCVLLLLYMPRHSPYALVRLITSYLRTVNYFSVNMHFTCVHIPFDKGVCGRCCTTKEAQRIDDVLAFAGHIACDSASRSELCVPILINGQVIGEIDLDSPETNRFTEEMEKEMLEAADDIARAYLQHHWTF